MTCNAIGSSVAEQATLRNSGPSASTSRGPDRPQVVVYNALARFASAVLARAKVDLPPMRLLP